MASTPHDSDSRDMAAIQVELKQARERSDAALKDAYAAHGRALISLMAFWGKLL